MKNNYLSRIGAISAIFITLAPGLKASWLSELFTCDFGPSRETVQVGMTPKPPNVVRVIQELPSEIQRLPSNMLANLAGMGQGMAASGGSQGGAQQEQFAYFNVNGHYLYGDAQLNLYPADPTTGTVLGPANGRVFLQNGQYWAVDSVGGTYAAIRVH